MLLTFVVCQPSAVSAQESDRGLIAYIGQDHNVWLVRADGSEARQITSDAVPGSSQWEAMVGYSELRWSPDGEMLGFSRKEYEEFSILVMRVSDFTVTTVVSSDAYGGYGFDWLPNGRSIVFSDVSGGLSIVNLDTGAVASFIRAEPDLRMTRPDWAPVGDHTFFGIQSYIPGEMVTLDNLYLAEAPDGTYIDTQEGLLGCDWSPDGQQFICCTQGAYGGCPFYVLLSASGAHSGTILETLGGLSFSPIWSPDGEFIAYGSEVSLATYVAEVENNEVVRVSMLVEGDYFYYDPLDWSPDSDYLLALSPDDSIVIINIASSDVTELAPASQAAMRPTRARYLVSAWQPAIQRAELDLGFRPNPNGYGFVNTQLERSEEMFEQYFGEENITDSDGNWCKGARSYFDKEYRTLGGADGWSCLGFSLTSLLSYLDQPQPDSGLFAIRHFERLYEQPDSAQLTFSTRLADSIAYYAGVQEGKQWEDKYEEWKETCSTNPDEMVERIRTGIRDRKPVVLSLNTFVYGLHTVAPYRVEETSSNTIDVYVYDSEAPGQERIVHFEREGDSWQWTYTFVGSVGAAETRTAGCVDMYPFPLESIGREQGKPPHDFCQTADRTSGKSSPRDGVSPGKMLALVPTQGDVLIQDTLGRRIGWVGGTFVSEIPDAYEVPYALGDATLLHHTLRLPAAEYVVTANGLSAEAVELVFYVDGHFIELSAQPQPTGLEVQLEIGSSLEQATLSGLQNLSSFALSLDNESAPESHLVTISGTPLSGSEDLRVSFDGAQVKLSHAGGGLQQYDLRFENSGGQVFTSEPLALEANETHALSPANWTELESASVVWEIDDDSDGTIDETLVLEDRASVPMPTPTATVSPENGEGKGPCPGSLVMIGLVGLAAVVGLTRRSIAGKQ